MTNRILKLFATLCCVLFLSGTAMAQTAIKVVVNGQAVTSYDIAQRARLITLTQRVPAARANGMAKQELIDEVLKNTETKRLGIKVTDDQVKDAYATIAGRLKLSPANLTRALAQNGVNADTLKARLRSELGWTQALRMRFRSEVKISENDVINALKSSDIKDKDTSVEYNLTQVIFVVPSKASAGYKAQRRREVDALRRDFTSCESGLAKAHTYKEVVIKPLGHRLEVELPADSRDEISKTEKGHLTAPTKVSAGLQLIAVCDKKEIKSDIAARTQMEDELREKRGRQMTISYLHDLRQNATIEYR